MVPLLVPVQRLGEVAGDGVALGVAKASREMAFRGLRCRRTRELLVRQGLGFESRSSPRSRVLSSSTARYPTMPTTDLA